MSRCAHLSPWVHLPRNVAAVIAPPSRPPMLAKSAKLLLSCSAYSSVSGSFQQLAHQRRIVAHEARVMVSECDHARPGERRDVDDGCRMEAARVVQRIA